LEGRWGLPDWPVEKWLHGKAHFDPRAGISLTVDGLLGELPNQIPSKLDEYAAVYGATNESKRVTLLDVTGGLGEMKFGQTGANISGKYHALKMAIGEFVPASAELKCRSVAVRFHNLEEFFGRHGFNDKFEKEASSISYRLPQSVDLRLDDIPVSAGYRAGFAGEEFERRQIWQQAWFTAKPVAEVQLDVLLRGIFASLHYLVELAAGHRIPILQIEADSSRTDIHGGGQTLHRPTQIFLSQKRPLPLPSREHPVSMLFTLGALGNDASRYIENWHHGFKAFRDALDFYFSLDPDFDTDVAIEHHFLAAANAFESLHRIIGKTQFERPQTDHDGRIEKILERAPDEFRGWLKRKLRHSNEVSLEQRLREAYLDMPDKLRPVLGDEKFPTIVAATRNAFAHHTERLKGRALKEATEIWLATKRLRLIMQAQFLKRMGFDDSLLPEVLSRSADFQILQREVSGKE
jgi:hypothetical protein